MEEVVAEATAQIWSSKDKMTKFAKEHEGLFKDMAEEAFSGESFEIYQDMFEAQAVSFYSKENYLHLYEDRRYLGGEGVESGRVGKRFEGLLERKRRNSASGVDGTVDSYSLNNSPWNEEVAKDLAEQLMNNTGNAGKIAEILVRMGDNMWADHRIHKRKTRTHMRSGFV